LGEVIVSTENLLDALDDYIRAKTVYDKARDRYDGYEWGYHGYDERTRMDNARKQFQIELDEYIDKRIEARLNPVDK
jgi:hypothetical protein